MAQTAPLAAVVSVGIARAVCSCCLSHASLPWQQRGITLALARVARACETVGLASRQSGFVATFMLHPQLLAWAKISSFVGDHGDDMVMCKTLHPHSQPQAPLILSPPPSPLSQSGLNNPSFLCRWVKRVAALLCCIYLYGAYFVFNFMIQITIVHKRGV